jgi:hypothetical protein
LPRILLFRAAFFAAAVVIGSSLRLHACTALHTGVYPYVGCLCTHFLPQCCVPYSHTGSGESETCDSGRGVAITFWARPPGVGGWLYVTIRLNPCFSQTLLTLTRRHAHVCSERGHHACMTHMSHATPHQLAAGRKLIKPQCLRTDDLNIVTSTLLMR